MTADISLYLAQPGALNRATSYVGQFVIRGVSSSGQVHQGQECLDLEVDTLPSSDPLTITRNNVPTPLTVSWLQLNVELRTNRVPQRRIGRVHIDDAGMPPLGVSRSSPTRWLWEVLPEDVEMVEGARASEPTTPIHFLVDVRGIAKLVSPNNDVLDIVSIRGAPSQLNVELSQWERLLQQVGYGLSPSQSVLAGTATLEHPSWKEATTKLANARSHHRRGEDYDALRECLSSLEAIVTNPYNKESWKRQLASLPRQKADGIAELLSGLATYCNRIGHHRDRAERNAAGDLSAMPLEHWEADVVLGSSQFVLAYAMRLRSAGVLREPPSPEAPSQDTVTATQPEVS